MELHLMNNYPLDFYRFERNAGYPALPDGLRVASRQRGYLDRDKCRLELAEGFYVPHVTPEIYDYQIGVERPLHNWLRRRKGDEFTLPMYLHLLDIIYTIEMSLKIEALINEYNVPEYDVHRTRPHDPQLAPAAPAAAVTKGNVGTVGTLFE